MKGAALHPLGDVMKNALRGLLLLLLLAMTSAAAAPNTWSLTGEMSVLRNGMTSTLLPSGKVLVTGGSPTGGFGGAASATAELYDPATGTWSPTGSMSTARRFHSATLLPSGLVLVTGGSDPGTPAAAELYDPATGLWTLTGAPTRFRFLATATLLPSGKVLVAGGVTIDGVDQTLVVEATAELYDPSTGQWSATGTMVGVRWVHAATLLPSGKVLVSGGANTSSPATSINSAELYDPASGLWTVTGAMQFPRAFHGATLLAFGKVLAVGSLSTLAVPNSTELYDPATGVWTNALPTLGGHQPGTTVLLPSGKLLVVGGADAGVGGPFDNSAETFDPVTGQWTAVGGMSGARAFAGVTLLASGQVLAAGGTGYGLQPALKSAEVFDPASGHWGPVLGTMSSARQRHTATSLGSGKVLFAGGFNTVRSASAEVFDSSTQQWTATAPMVASRANHTATRLSSGKVLVAGGNSSGPNAELFDSAAGIWATTASMTFAREGHTATLLPSGKVLISGGTTDVPANAASAEIYDPANGQWSATGSLQAARAYHTATLLPSGKVLIAGGVNALIPGVGLASAELYDPATNQWTSTGPLSAQRQYHTATLLPSGKVLVVGGFAPQSGIQPTTSELYDPSTGLWTTTGAIGMARSSHSATLLPSGQVLVAGGTNAGAALSSAEIYDPPTGKWSPTASLDGRYSQTATLLPYGDVLIAGGVSSTGSVVLMTGVLFDAGLAPNTGVSLHSVRQPTLSSVPAIITQGSTFTATSSGSSTSASGSVTATGFMPRLEAHTGSASNSANNLPVIQVQRLDNEQMRFLRNDKTVSRTDTTIVSAADALVGFPPGPIMLRVWVNGVPSMSLSAILRSDRIFANGFD